MGLETIEAGDPLPCMQCGQTTRRLVIVWHGPLCSEACDAAFEDDFWKACAKKSSPTDEANDLIIDF